MNIIKKFSPIIVAVLMALIPTPEGLTPEGWYFLSIFVGVVVGLIIEPVPAALVGLAGVTLVAVLGLVDPSATASRNWMLSGFSNGVIWLIFAAFMFALGYQKTGLGKRISLHLIRFLGKSTLGLGYAIAFSDAVLAPFMPSNTARSAGTIYPIASNIPPMFNSTPDNEPRKMGAYLHWVGIAATCVTSSMFLTALAPNLLAVDMIQKSSDIVITWGQWAKIMLPAMLPLFLLTPWLAYVIYPPTQKHSPEAPAWAKEELNKMGKTSIKELMMLGYAIMALIFWIFGKELGVNSTVAAVFVLSLMILTNIITWEDVITNKGAWNVLVWFATLVAMASGLKKTGVLAWIGDMIANNLVGMSPSTVVIMLVILFFVLHYFFASTTAHTTALLPLFMATAAPLLPPEMLPKLALMLAGSLGLMGIITPYATGPSPIWYGAGFISQARWWALGAVFGGLYLAAMIAVTVFYV
ncbi:MULTISPECIES: anion permease [unclassified Pseudodesulfovibrio]|uniref:anion permease n=1 Tax=unclassified Pseudodesulfovibrio TaxID=2661612 RepID=UPI000FEBFAB2|nr:MULTISPECIES: anion permease [unclassified Pseudodesulfovibrio]MCJ2164234.1 anion permease [Pseudodesulfovibrio sp. S3-i]RWU05142.1 anion permease [Pseudodesulfovibrio sp. S3]